MNNEENVENVENDKSTGRVSGLGQKIIGEIEVIGGILTGDPLTQAEGEFNVEVGEIREGAEDALREN